MFVALSSGAKNNVPSGPGQTSHGITEALEELLEKQLRHTLRDAHRLQYDAQVRADAFLFGALCAKAGGQVPDWLNDSVLWAHEAALQGFFAFWFARADQAEPASSDPRLT